MVEVTQADRTPLEMSMFAAWINVPPDSIPDTFTGHTNPHTMESWKRVGQAAIRSLADDPAMVELVARALCAHDDAIWDATDFTQTPCGNTPEDMRAGYIDAAQAVLRAIGGVE